ncbi:MAG: VanW family protein [Clostridia bacterium]
MARSSGNTGRYDTRSSGYNSSPSGRKPSSSKRKKMLQRRRMVVAVSSLILLGLLVLAVVVIARSCATPVEIDPATDAFRSGVYINGANVSGKTIEEVKATLESNEQYAINNIAITLQGDGFSKTITGMDMAATTNLNEVLTAALSGGSNQVYYTEISLDKDALSQRIDEINQTLTAPPTDASFTVEVSESGKPTFTYLDGKAGFGIDVAATEELVHQAFVNKQFQTSITPPLTTVDPLITVADVKAHTTLVGSFTTTYDFKGTAENTEEQRLELIPNRAYNVEKCAGLINNQVVKPGHSWSFNDTVGDRNEKNGWKEANGIFGGDTFSRQYGGGVCQVSTTLYNALLKCYPYVKLNRQKHSIPSTYVDKGLDATVDTGHIDFSFKNTSEYPLYVFAYISKNKQASGRKRNITVNIYGEALPEGITYEPHTELMEEILPGEPEITESKKLFIGEEQILAEARSGFVVDVYIDRYLNGALQESIFLYKDTYDGNPLRKRVGIIATPTPIPSATPAPTPIPNGGQDLP